MKSRDSRLTPEKYAELKNMIYERYLSDIEHPERDEIPKLYKELENCGIPAVLEVLGDTIEYPFDKELSEFFNRNKKMKAHDFVLTASNLYGIGEDLVVSKIREYLYYDYSKLLRENMINQDLVLQLSELYLNKNQGKNQK